MRPWFTYHSHANETVQIERGLYSALIVLGPDDPVFDADRLLVLDDVKLDRRGNIANLNDGDDNEAVASLDIPFRVE